ncbi:uncharacterized protein ColSpa_03642 [Colletotrichum spaethianum]|uniref:Uncharacterized protein n=1 Tax=Colletotrichum spaethianum TaxID=700344 RepID=A0AA37P5D4_9PEZI|nr:uncharacterized protein ColSpa_03642 [Colletotrichum spaethianum]GKT43461.1 hypothetical protein ColSpa_03642 [Colletotrichum spaethianum]
MWVSTGARTAPRSKETCRNGPASAAVGQHQPDAIPAEITKHRTTQVGVDYSQRDGVVARL